MQSNCKRHIVSAIFTVFVLAFTGATAQQYYPQCTQGPAESGFAKSAIDTTSGSPLPLTMNFFGQNPESVHALVIVARFPDDSATSSTWQAIDSLPPEIVNLVWSNNSQTYQNPEPNVSKYFYLNSYGQFGLTGEVFYITLPHDEDYYAPENYNQLELDAVAALDTLMQAQSRSFREFDRWKFNGSNFVYTYPYQASDNLIDLTFFVLRNTPQNLMKNLGKASLLFTGASLPYTYDNFKYDEGISVIGPNIYANTYLEDAGTSLYGTVIHEISHILLADAEHFGDGVNQGITAQRYSSHFHGYAAIASNCYGNYSGLEKANLQWLSNSYTQRRRIVPTVTLNDTLRLFATNVGNPLVSSGPQKGCNLIEVPIDSTEASPQTILIEYRNLDDKFETKYSTTGNGYGAMPDGVLVYHVISEGSVLSSTKAQILCADGNFDWTLELDGQDDTTGWHRWDIIENEQTNPYNGYNERELIKIKDGTGNWYSDFWRASYQTYTQGQVPSRGPYRETTNKKDPLSGGADHGGDVFDLFTTGDVISPYTNPPTRVWVEDSSKFNSTLIGIHILGSGLDQNRPYYDVRIVRGDSTATLPPARIQNVSQGASVGGDCPSLSWAAAMEPDVAVTGMGRYVVSMAIDAGSYSVVDTLYHPYTELSIDFSTVPDGIHKISYTVAAIDTSGNRGAESLPDTLWVALDTLNTLNTAEMFVGRDLHIVGDCYVMRPLEIPGFTNIHFCPNSTMYIDSSVIVKYAEFDENSHIVCNGNGQFIIDNGANIDKLKYVDIEQSGRMVVNDSSYTRMLAQGKITVKKGGYVEATPANTGVFDCYTPQDRVEPYSHSTYWYGFDFEEDSDGEFRNITISGAYTAITTDRADIVIDSSRIAYNYLGVNLIGGAPQMTHCELDSNAWFGALTGLFEDHTPEPTANIRDNWFHANLYGMQVGYTNVPYYANRIDTNYFGWYLIQDVFSLFGILVDEGGGYTYCNYDAGNSSRENDADGFEIWYSDITFNCNSVHSNSGYDFDLHQSNLSGTRNYPDSATVDTLLDQTSSFVWDGPYPGSDPISKIASRPGWRFVRNNPSLDTSLGQIRDAASSQLYSPAVTLCNSSLGLVQSESEARHVFKAWLSTMRQARRDTVSQDVISQRRINPYTLFNTRLDTLAVTHDSLWMRQTAKYYRAVRAMADGDYASARLLYNHIQTDSVRSDAMDITTLSPLVMLNMRVFKDTATAYAHYLTFDSRHHYEKSRVIAKIHLGLLLNEEDIRILKGQTPSPSPAAQQQQTVEPQAKLDIRTSAFPNPFNPATTITYDLPTDSKVYLAVYSLSGNHVATLVNEEQTKGAYTVPFSGELLPSGVYVYNLYTINLETRERHITQGNMMLTK